MVWLSLSEWPWATRNPLPTPDSIPWTIFCDSETRPVVRIRIRSIVVRIHVGDTAIRIRVVVAAIDHTAYENFRLFDLQSYSFPARIPKKSTNIDGLKPVFLDVFVPQTSRFFALSLRSRFRFLAYATSVAALNAATLCATTTFPRKARRDPKPAYELDASLFAPAYDTPPFAYA